MVSLPRILLYRAADTVALQAPEIVSFIGIIAQEKYKAQYVVYRQR